jgi:hypothetical protein
MKPHTCVRVDIRGTVRDVKGRGSASVKPWKGVPLPTRTTSTGPPYSIPSWKTPPASRGCMQPSVIPTDPWPRSGHGGARCQQGRGHLTGGVPSRQKTCGLGDRGHTTEPGCTCTHRKRHVSLQLLLVAVCESKRRQPTRPEACNTAACGPYTTCACPVAVWRSLSRALRGAHSMCPLTHPRDSRYTSSAMSASTAAYRRGERGQQGCERRSEESGARSAP